MTRLPSSTRVTILLAFVAAAAFGTPIDNGVEGDPEIECSSDSITVNFNTRNEFQGHIYVKGRFNEEGCRVADVGRRVAGIKLEFSQCGTKRERSLNPRGVFVTNTVVISFHPQFLTKVDRAYTVQCFYMEADKTVSQSLEVSEITTAFQTQQVPMPVCRYDILDGGASGQPVKFANIGQIVYHKWTCDTETVDIFCALIHSCVVDDGAGNNVQLLNDQGCALDRYLLNNLEYQTDLTAGQEAMVFKYADKPALFFQCQITIAVKEPGQQCPRPQCPEAGGPNGQASGVAPAVTNAPRQSPTTAGQSGTSLATRRDFAVFPFKFRRRYQRSAGWSEFESEFSAPVTIGTWDVSAPRINALDVDEQPQQRQSSNIRNITDNQTFRSSLQMRQSQFCLSTPLFALMLAALWASVIAAATSIFYVCSKRAKKQRLADCRAS